MLTLNYTIERNGVQINDSRLMLSESQINHLMESFYEHGYDIIAMEVK